MTETPAYARRMRVLAREPQLAGPMKQLADAILPGQPRSEADVEVSHAGVRVDGELLPAHAIAQGFWVPRPKNESSVRLLDEVGATIFEARVDDEADAQAFLAALGRDVSRQRIAFEADPPYGLSTRHRLVSAVVAALALFATFKVATIPSALVFGAMALNYVVMTIAPTARVEVGSDGILVAWLWSRRFVSYVELASVEPLEDGVRLVLRSGRPRDVRLTSSSGSKVELLVRRDALIARVRDAIAARSRETSRQELLARLVRGGRTTEQWTREVALIRSPDEGYRTGAVREEDLWDVVRDATAPADARAAAALVVRRTGDDRAKLRVAADAVVEPRLRVALEAAAEDDDAALDAALEHVARE